MNFVDERAALVLCQKPSGVGFRELPRIKILERDVRPIGKQRAGEGCFAGLAEDAHHRKARCVLVYKRRQQAATLNVQPSDKL